MKFKQTLMMIALLGVLALLLVGCAGTQSAPEPGPIGPAGPAGPQGPAGPPGDDAVVSREYVGVGKCAECHEDAYTKYQLSGHPYNLTKIEGAAPVFPYDGQTGGVPNPPEGYSWDDIAYVIGGFAWKAQFVNQDGYLIANPPGQTGVADYLSQYNLANSTLKLNPSWAPYHGNPENLAFSCGQCHTTGYSTRGFQDDKPGLIGTWAFEGVQCEACHGPGSLHVADPYGVAMEVDRSSQACGECHSRGDSRIDAADGFSEQYVQYDQLHNNEHFAIGCIGCHDPHSSSVYTDVTLNPNAGITQTCDTCHWEQAAYSAVRKHFALFCTDCHMPPTGLSAVGNLDRFTGDLSSHVFSINPNPNAAQFSADGEYAMPYITLDYACKHCHGPLATEKDMDMLATAARGYHTPPQPTPEPTPAPEPTATPDS